MQQIAINEKEFAKRWGGVSGRARQVDIRQAVGAVQLWGSSSLNSYRVLNNTRACSAMALAVARSRSKKYIRAYAMHPTSVTPFALRTL